MKKIFVSINNARYNRPQSVHASKPFPSSQPRPASPAARQGPRYGRERSVHDENLPQRCAFPRTRLYAGLPSAGSSHEDQPDANGSGGAHGPFRATEPRSAAFDPTREGWPSDVRRDQPELYVGAHARVCARVCAASQDFSSVLLDMKPSCLVLGPGGMGFFALLGAYSKLEEQLSDVTDICGSSAGALLGLFIALGKTSTEILDISMGIDIPALTKYNIKSFMSSYGLIDHSQIREVLVSICEGDPTFSDIDKTIYIAAFNVNLGRTEYFSKYTHPTMSVIDAVCMSISVPFIFSSFKFNGYNYVDGGTMECVPVPPFFGKKPDDVLIIHIISDLPVHEDIHSVKDYLGCLIRSILRVRVNYQGMFPTIDIDIHDTNMFDFNMSDDEKLKLFLNVKI